MKRTIVCISHRSYPWGGGEEDLYDKCQLMHHYGLDVVWVSFVDATGSSNHGTTVCETIFA